MFPDVFRHDRRHLPLWDDIIKEIGEEPLPENFEDTVDGYEEFEKANDQYRRLISKTPLFKEFVEARIEKAQRASSLVGNQYTGSIFLALMSTIESDFLDDEVMIGERIGLCGYGSGAKAKVFEGIVQSEWKDVATEFNLFNRLTERHPINKEIYESLHRGSQKESVVSPKKEFALLSVGGVDVLEGQRKYSWIE
jgi:hydroxymethylglutaryl-CoA synthase